MDAKDILNGINSDNFADRVTKLKNEKKGNYNPDKYIKDYEGDHDILRRPPKIVKIKDKDGNEKGTESIEMNKIVMNFNKKIVSYAKAFMLGDNATIKGGAGNEKTLQLNFEDVWKKVLKMDAVIDEFIKVCMVETKAAVIFYQIVDKKISSNVFKRIMGVKDTSVSIRTRVLTAEKKDRFYPNYDRYGDMDAFTHEYSIVNDEGQNVVECDIYTADFIYHAAQDEQGAWKLDAPKKNLFGKIPAVYHENTYPEWGDAETLINRIELMISKFSDSNDYFAFPALVAKGVVKNLPSKDSVGKLFQINGTKNTKTGATEYGEVGVLTWDRAPDAIKLEYEILKDSAFSNTSTPDLSFNNVKGMNTISGVALKFMLTDAFIKATENRQRYTATINRMINFLKSAMDVMSQFEDKGKYSELDIVYKYGEVLPQNVLEIAQILSEMTAGEKVISQRTAVKINPLVTDPDSELDEIKAEEKAGETGINAESFNI